MDSEFILIQEEQPDRGLDLTFGGSEFGYVECCCGHGLKEAMKSGLVMPN